MCFACPARLVSSAESLSFHSWLNRLVNGLELLQETNHFFRHLIFKSFLLSSMIHDVMNYFITLLPLFKICLDHSGVCSPHRMAQKCLGKELCRFAVDLTAGHSTKCGCGCSFQGRLSSSRTRVWEEQGRQWRSTPESTSVWMEEW